MRTLTIRVALLLTSLGLNHLFSSEDLSPNVLRVARALQTNRQLLERLPRYTCLETITREYAEGKKQKRRKQDVLQLDVAVGTGREMYSWPGARAFSSQELPDLVGHGFLSAGLFGMFANGIFASRHVLVSAVGEEILQGQSTFKFRYRTSSLEAKWMVDWLGRSGEVDQQGEFWVDQSNSVLLRLTAMAVQIPATLPLKELMITIDYQLSDNSRALLPMSAQSRAVETNGNTNYNAILFSHCHVFEAESRMAEAGESLKQTMNQYEGQRQLLPAGLTIPVWLDTSINPAEVKVGDLLLAHLEKAVPIRPGLIAPQNASLHGRIRAFHRLPEPPNTFTVGLEFDELMWPGHSFSFFAETVFLQPLPGLDSALFVGNTQTRSTQNGLLSVSTTERMQPTRIPGVATFFWHDGSVIPRGFRMVWRTKQVASK